MHAIPTKTDAANEKIFRCDMIAFLYYTIAKKRNSPVAGLDDFGTSRAGEPQPGCKRHASCHCLVDLDQHRVPWNRVHQNTPPGPREEFDRERMIHSGVICRRRTLSLSVPALSAPDQKQPAERRIAPVVKLTMHRPAKCEGGST